MASETETTYWEQVARSRWGAYVTEIEHQAIEAAASRANEIGDRISGNARGNVSLVTCNV